MKTILCWNGFGFFMVAAPLLAWVYPRTDALFGMMNGLAAVAIGIATIFLGALFMNQGKARNGPCR